MYDPRYKITTPLNADPNRHFLILFLPSKRKINSVVRARDPCSSHYLRVMLLMLVVPTLFQFICISICGWRFAYAEVDQTICFKCQALQEEKYQQAACSR